MPSRKARQNRNCRVKYFEEAHQPRIRGKAFLLKENLSRQSVHPNNPYLCTSLKS